MWYQKDWFTGSDYYNLKRKNRFMQKRSRLKSRSNKNFMKGQRYIMLRAVTPIFGSTEINIK